MNFRKHKYYSFLRDAHLFTQKKCKNLSSYSRKLQNAKILKENYKKGIFAVNIQTSMGIGANLVWALEVLAYAHDHNLIPQIKFTRPETKLKEDYFNSFFEIKQSSQLPTSFQYATLCELSDLGLGFTGDYNGKLDLKFANLLITKYLDIRPAIKSAVQNFENQYFKKTNILGVHYRGTDKKAETQITSFKTVENNIITYLNKYPETQRIFISSDEQQFINFMESLSLPVPICYHNDSKRALDDIPLHVNSNNLVEINRDAIINCLLLSKCTTLLKTPSILSDWSALFNPNINLILINKPFEKYQYFPGKEFYNSVLYEAI